MRGKTEREAIEKFALKKRDIEEGKVAVSSNMSASAWAYKAVNTYKTRQKEVTRKTYESRMKHCILEKIGSMPLKTDKPIHCQETLNKQAGKSKAQIAEVCQLRREMNIALGCRVYRNELLSPFPLAEDFVPYCLRHTYCTDLQKKALTSGQLNT